MGVETQRGGVFDEQILPPGHLAGLRDPLRVRGHNRVMGDIGFSEQPIGGPQILPVGKGSGQGAVGVLGQSRGDRHQPLGAAAVTNVDVAHFLSRPKSGGAQE